jgi:RimJ/RimL family protein N-acetyltransferase
MEMMPFNAAAASREPLVAFPRGLDQESPDWQSMVPMLVNGTVRLRELRCSDAASLLSMLSTEEVSRFISPPPTTIEGYEQFIRWSHRKRAEGTYVCFGIVPAGGDAAVGIMQIQLRPGEPAEWGFAMGSPFWGTGLFVEGAEAVLNFAFEGMGIEQLGARAAIANGRGNGALRKVGAACEGVIANGLVLNGRALDQYYWTVSADDRPRRKIVWDLRTH